jgi:hypothetical protein
MACTAREIRRNEKHPEYLDIPQNNEPSPKRDMLIR